MTDARAGRFRRRRALVPMVLGVVALIAVFAWIEVRRNAGRDLIVQVRDRQERLQEFASLEYAISEAESAQRGYLLTGDMAYMEPFDRSEMEARVLLGALRERFTRLDAGELPALAAVGVHIDQRFAELRSALATTDGGGRAAALAGLRGGSDARTSLALHAEVAGLQRRERARFATDDIGWRRMVAENRLINTANLLLTLTLIAAIGMMLIRDLERRAALADELDAKVAERTGELTALGDHSRRVIEADRSRLARELHDELGGILVGIKMDLAQLARHVDLSQPALAQRWAAIQAGLTSGIELKRRVIEELRPTLLDNMGLAAAMRWQAEEICRRAGLRLRLDLPHPEPALDPDIAIELFRVLQESLTNIVKHARATTVTVRLGTEVEALQLCVEDDGVGLPPRSVPAGSHGLLGMRHRARSMGGSFDVAPVAPRGTRVLVRVPRRLEEAAAVSGA